MRKKIIISMLMVLCALISCERRPLEDPNFSTEIEVRINLDAISNVTCDVYNDKIPIPDIDPEVMKVMFYSTSNKKLLAESFISEKDKADGHDIIKGRLSILPGEYSMTLYQFGSETTRIQDEQEYRGAFAYTDAITQSELKELKISSLSTSKGETKFDGQTINYQPEHLVVASSDYENIPYHEGVHTITVDATSIAESYYLQVKVEGLEYVSSAKAVLTSMVKQVNLATREKDLKDPCALYTHLIKSDDKGVPVVCNVFNTFGHIDDLDTKLNVVFDFWTTDGRNIQREFDISYLFDTQDCIQHHWLLVDETIVIPPPETPDPGTGGGFDPSVGDWDEEHHEIEM